GGARALPRPGSSETRGTEAVPVPADVPALRCGDRNCSGDTRSSRSQAPAGRLACTRARNHAWDHAAGPANTLATQEPTAPRRPPNHSGDVVTPPGGSGDNTQMRR